MLFFIALKAFKIFIAFFFLFIIFIIFINYINTNKVIVYFFAFLIIIASFLTRFIKLLAFFLLLSKVK